MDLIPFLEATCPYEKTSALMQIIGIAKAVVTVLQIIVPIALIVWGTIDIGKSVIAGDEKKIKEAQKPFVKRIIAAIIVFCIPFLVNLILNFVSKGTWYACWGQANGKVDTNNGIWKDIKKDTY